MNYFVIKSKSLKLSLLFSSSINQSINIVDTEWLSTIKNKYGPDSHYIVFMIFIIHFCLSTVPSSHKNLFQSLAIEKAVLIIGCDLKFNDNIGLIPSLIHKILNIYFAKTSNHIILFNLYLYNMTFIRSCRKYCSNGCLGHF